MSRYGKQDAGCAPGDGNRRLIWRRAATLVFLCCAVVALLAACGRGDSSSASEPEVVPGTGGSKKRHEVESGELQFQPPAEGAPIAVIETSAGEIRMVLYPEVAPLAVENFTALAQAGYYDGTVFHRVVHDFVIQGGDGTGTGKGGASIWGQPYQTERSDKLHHYSGTVAMAAADGAADTHLSQFYVLATPQDNLDEAALAQLRDAGLREDVVQAYGQAGGAPWLDNTDTVFAQVYAGMDVVDAIAAAALNEDGSPRRPVEIISVRIESYGGGAASQPDGAGSSTVPDGQPDTSGSSVADSGGGSSTDDTDGTQDGE